MHVAMTFSTTQFKIAQRHWHRCSVAGATGTGVGLGGQQAGQPGAQPFLGGKLVVVDWDTGRIVWDMDLDAPSGFVVEESRILCNNMRLHYISVIDAARRVERDRISSPSFNDLHSLERIGDRLLVTSSGVDAIVEIDESGRTTFSWWATQHGFDRVPDGTLRCVDPAIDHRPFFYPTLGHSTHVNSAYPDHDGRIVATFFHAGRLVRLDRSTGRIECLLDELDCPHGPRPRSGGGWTLPDTRRGRVLLLDDHFAVRGVISGGYGWVQDAVPLPDGRVLLGDANHHRIVDIDPATGSVVREFSYSEDWRLYQLRLVEWSL